MRLGRGQRAVEFKSSCAQSFWSYLPLHDAWAAMRCCWSVLPLPKLNFMAKSDRDFVVACYDGQVEAVTLMLKSGQFDGNTSTSGQSALCAAAAGVRGGRPQSDEIKVRLVRLLCAHGADPNRFNWRKWSRLDTPSPNGLPSTHGCWTRAPTSTRSSTARRPSCWCMRDPRYPPPHPARGPAVVVGHQRSSLGGRGQADSDATLLDRGASPPSHRNARSRDRRRADDLHQPR